MSSYGGANIVTDGLVLSLDAANRKSYPGSGNTWTNLSSNINNGGFASTGSNFPTYSSLAGGSIQFDQASSYVTSSFSYSSSPLLWSTSVWFNPTNYSNGPFLAGGASGVGFTENIQIAGTGRISGGTKNSGNIPYSATTISSAPLNQWSNVVITVDWIRASVKAYFNGNLEATNTNVSGSIMNSTFATHIARRGDGGNYFGGAIAVVQIYNRALSAAEILQNYNGLKSRFNL